LLRVIQLAGGVQLRRGRRITLILLVGGGQLGRGRSTALNDEALTAWLPRSRRNASLREADESMEIKNLAESLVRAGTAPEQEIDRLVEQAGLDAVTGTLVQEILFRCDAPVNIRPVNVAVEITHRGERRLIVLRIHRESPVQVSDERDPVVWSQVSMSVTRLIRRLYGRSANRQNGDFLSSFMPTSPYPQNGYFELPDIMRSATQATGAVMSGLAPFVGDLGSLAVRYDSDKWASFHWYTPHYERHFSRLRDEPVRVLEIGIGGYGKELGGGSLKMWKRFFHRGLIFGLDVFDKTELNEPRLTALVGDQGDPGSLTALAEEYGPFDIIIDDGSHDSGDIHTSFRTLFGYLADGGLYVIEDLQTAYMTSFGGSAGTTAEPHTSIGLVKRLLDDLHYQERKPVAGEEVTLTQRSVTGVHVYHNIVFIEKGINGEAGLPSWLSVAAWAVGAPDAGA
jgi:hypothetical protein